MEDSIERIREDIDKEAMEYWGCYDYDDCESCPSKRVDEECSKAHRIELVKRTRALFERQLPEGVEWPRFEDGELVGFGNYYVGCDGVAHEVKGVFVYGDEQPLIMYVSDGVEPITVMPGERIKRAEPADTQEKIDADAEKSFCEYFGHELRNLQGGRRVRSARFVRAVQGAHDPRPAPSPTRAVREGRAMIETVRKTPNGLHVTYDDGRNVHVAELRECPWCGGELEGCEPYVQTWDLMANYDEARVVCPSCGVATTRVWHNKTMIAKTGEDVTRDLAIEEAVILWNERKGDE